MYEDIACSFLASPKAYIIIIVSALLSSRINLIYGWDFNGILIPSLITLQWYDPFKILSTVGETIIILMLAAVILRIPWFRNMTIEKSSKVLLFFNISFAYRFFSGFLVLKFFPQAQVSDFFWRGLSGGHVNGCENTRTWHFCAFNAGDFTNVIISGRIC